MKKKAIKKQAVPKRTSAKSAPIGYIHIISITFVLAIIVLVGTLTVRAVSKTNVLGLTIGPTLLADQGDNGDSQGERTAPTNIQQNNDQQLNPSKQPEIHQSPETPQSHPEIPVQGNKSETILQTPDTHVELKHQGSTEIQIQNNGRRVEIGSSSAGEFSLKSGGVKAKSHFPLSVNPKTNQLTVTTPAGPKTVTILPNQAVQNLLQKQILSSVTQTSSSGAAANSISLTQVNNQPAFAVQGVADKKVLGLFPVSLNKTVYVSAQNGSVLQTQESFFNKILEALSF